MVSEISHSIFSKHIFAEKNGFLSFLELQKYLPVSFQGCSTQWQSGQTFTISEIPYNIWTQWQRFESSSMYHFWDIIQHFLKTHFCWESGFLLSWELQKSLPVIFQGCWTQWQRFESSSTHHFRDSPQHFLKTRMLNKMAKWSNIYNFWDTPQHLNTMIKVWKL